MYLRPSNVEKNHQGAEELATLETKMNSVEEENSTNPLQLLGDAIDEISRDHHD